MNIRTWTTFVDEGTSTAKSDIEIIDSEDGWRRISAMKMRYNLTV
ncbi:MAG: hypothetical protein WCL46_10795 [Chlorobium sp.]